MVIKRGLKFTGKKKSLKAEKIEIYWRPTHRNEQMYTGIKKCAVGFHSLKSINIRNSVQGGKLLDETSENFYPTSIKLKIETDYDINLTNKFVSLK